MTFHITNRCERCPRITDLTHIRSLDEYLCDDCIEKIAHELDYDDDAKQPYYTEPARYGNT